MGGIGIRMSDYNVIILMEFNFGNWKKNEKIREKKVLTKRKIQIT